MIIVKNLMKSYYLGKGKTINAINDTNLELPDTGLICICGESGSGKTTLLNVLGGLEEFKTGLIYYGEEILKSYNRKVYEQKRIENFGYIFQNYLLVEDCTVEYNIDIALEMSGLSKEERSDRIYQVLQAVNLEHYRNKLASELSGGEKQRLVIARVLAKAPKVIFADEPTANLDRKNAVMMMETLRQVAQTSLVIIVTHQKELAYCFADRIIYIKNGEIVEDVPNIPTGIQNIDMDGSIYLEDYKEESGNLGGMDIHIYGETEESSRLDIICIDGKYYLRVSDDSKGVLVNNQSEHIFLDSRTKRETKERKYNIPEIQRGKYVNRASIINRLSNALKGHMGGKKLAIEALFILNAILISLVITAFYTVIHPSKEKIVNTDSHYISVEIGRGNIADEQELNDIYDMILGNLPQGYKVRIDNQNPPAGEYIYTRSNLVFYGKKASQLEKIFTSFSNFSYAIAEDKLKEEDIILGRMPEKRGEIVLDRWIADRIIKSNDLVMKSYEKYTDFIDEVIRIDGLEVFPVTIVGISDTKEPNVYIDMLTSFYIAEWLKCAEYKEKTVRVYLNDFDSDDERAKIIDKEYDQLMKRVATYSHRFILDVDNPYEFLPQIRKNVDNIYNKYKIKVDISYNQQDEIDAYKEKYVKYINMLKLIGGIIAGISVVSIYYLLYVDIKVQRKLLTVYYVNGVNGKCLIASYFLSILKILCITVLPTIIIFRMAIWQINKLNTLNIRLEYPFYSSAFTIIMFFVISGVMSVILVKNFINKPVARQGILE